MHSPSLTPFHLPPAPDELREEFYFISFSFFHFSQSLYSLHLLVCFPQPLKSFSLIFDISYSLLLLYNIHTPIPLLLNFSQLPLLSTLLWFFCNFDPIGLIFQLYFKPHSILFLFFTTLFQLPFHVLLML